MNWQADVLATLAFHDEQQKLHGISPSGRPKKSGRSGWSLRDTATALNQSIGSTHVDLQLARNLDELGKYEDKQIAISQLRNLSRRSNPVP